MTKREGQSIQSINREGQSIQSTKREGQTIQSTKREGQSIQSINRKTVNNHLQNTTRKTIDKKHQTIDM